MKTFLGFTTGLFSGVFAGIVFTAILLIESEEFRDYVNTVANNADYT